MKCCTGIRFASRSAFAGLLLAALVCVLPGFAPRAGAGPQAPTASISGKISVASGASTTNHLAGITVTLGVSAPGAAPQTTVTDGEGYYKFTQLPAGSYTLTVTLDGFKPWTASVTLGDAHSAVQDAVLQINVVEEKVEVTGEATEVATQSVSASATLSDQQLETLPLRTEKFIDALSSPSVIQTQEGRLNFNGQSESQAMLLVDSVENMDPVSGSFAIPIPKSTAILIFTCPSAIAPRSPRFAWGSLPWTSRIDIIRMTCSTTSHPRSLGNSRVSSAGLPNS